MQEELTVEKVTAMFTLAEIKVKAVYEILNQYHGKRNTDPAFLINNPWFLVSTEYGNIVLGPRKQVYNLQWSETNLRQKLPCNEGEGWITSENTYVHSYTQEALIANLKKLGKALRALALEFVQKD